jgi:hypothetical protein
MMFSRDLHFRFVGLGILCVPDVGFPLPQIFPPTEYQTPPYNLSQTGHDPNRHIPKGARR